MTGEEKRRQLKEQYKRDLKLRKEFLEKAKTLRHQGRINKALGDMLEGMNDDSQDWIDQLNQETALSEAKFDLFVDQASEAEKKAEQIAKEAEMQRIQAESMVEKMKREMGLLPEESEKKESEKEEEAEETTEPKNEATEIEVEEGEEKEEDLPSSQQEPPAPKPPRRKRMGDF
jgi:hypothetical protein